MRPLDWPRHPSAPSEDRGPATRTTCRLRNHRAPRRCGQYTTRRNRRRSPGNCFTAINFAAPKFELGCLESLGRRSALKGEDHNPPFANLNSNSLRPSTASSRTCESGSRLCTAVGRAGHAAAQAAEGRTNKSGTASAMASAHALGRAYGEDRYRNSPLLRRRALSDFLFRHST